MKPAPLGINLSNKVDDVRSLASGQVLLASGTFSVSYSKNPNMKPGDTVTGNWMRVLLEDCGPRPHPASSACAIQITAARLERRQSPCTADWAGTHKLIVSISSADLTEAAAKMDVASGQAASSAAEATTAKPRKSYAQHRRKTGISKELNAMQAALDKFRNK